MQPGQQTSPYIRPVETVSEEKIIEYVMKSWLVFLKEIPELSGLEILPSFPDDSTMMKFPTLVMSRVGEDVWDYGARNSGYYGIVSNIDETTLDIVKGVQYRATYQFDLLTLTIKDQAKYEAILSKNFRRSSNFFDDSAYLEKIIPIYDFTSNPRSDTDLSIRFKPRRDVMSIRIEKVFDKAQVHQTAFSVNFWMDYKVSKEYPRILHIVPSSEILQIPHGITPIT